MGRSPTSDYDYIHSRKGPGDRQLDTLHPNQESPVTMGSPTFNRHKTGVQGKALIVMLMLSIARIGNAFVKVTVPEPTVIVPQGANVNLTCLFSDDQGAGFDEVNARWKLITTNEVFSEGIVTIWDMKQQKGNTTLMISHLQKAQVGQFSCIVWIRESFDYGNLDVKILAKSFKTKRHSYPIQVIPTSMGVDMWDGPSLRIKCTPKLGSFCKIRKTRTVQQAKEIKNVQQELGQENLVVGLVRDFGKMQNVTAITACLPLPKAAGDPIPWGIIPLGEMPPEIVNGTRKCNKELRNRTRIVEEVYTYGGRWSTPKQRSECLKLSNPVFTKIGQHKNIGWCAFEVNQKRSRPVVDYYYEIVCQEGKEEWEQWKSIWGPSLLEPYSYIGPIHWCIEWIGSRKQEHPGVLGAETVPHNKLAQASGWNCSKVITCDTPESQIGLIPVRVLLKWGCECQKYNHTITGELKGAWKDCQSTTVRSPGNSVWVMGHGQWTTHLPIGGPITQITLGIPTLCPFWKQSKLTKEDQEERTKRELSPETDETVNLENEWHEPGGSVKFGWMLESLFAPVSTYRNREMLYKLLGQTERLAAVTKKGFRDLNLQLQATTRMTIQNSMALDLLLLKEHG
ncbi:uncharacterized protein M8220_017630, partial [Acridotheres tristis]